MTNSLSIEFAPHIRAAQLISTHYQLRIETELRDWPWLIDPRTERVRYVCMNWSVVPPEFKRQIYQVQNGYDFRYGMDFAATQRQTPIMYPFHVTVNDKPVLVYVQREFVRDFEIALHEPVSIPTMKMIANLMEW